MYWNALNVSTLGESTTMQQCNAFRFNTCFYTNFGACGIVHLKYKKDVWNSQKVIDGGGVGNIIILKAIFGHELLA